MYITALPDGAPRFVTFLAVPPAPFRAAPVSFKPFRHSLSSFASFHPRRRTTLLHRYGIPAHHKATAGMLTYLLAAIPFLAPWVFIPTHFAAQPESFSVHPQPISVRHLPCRPALCYLDRLPLRFSRTTIVPQGLASKRCCRSSFSRRQGDVAVVAGAPPRPVVPPSRG